MKLEGRVWKPGKGRYWLIEVPGLDLMTQGKSRRNALEMAQDAIVELVNEEGFAVRLTPGKGNLFSVEPNELRHLIPLILKRRRQAQGLTIRDLASRLSYRSPNGYAQYEQGKSTPSLKTLERILKAIDPESAVVLRIA